MKKTISLLSFLLITTLSFAQDITQGTWFNDEKTAKIQFFKQGDKTSGKIIWLKDPNENGKPKVDKLNPNDKLKTRPILGLVNLTNFVSAGKNVWEDGQIYDPKSGKTYSSKITMVSPTRLDIRGFIGISLIGKTAVFTKAD